MPTITCTPGGATDNSLVDEEWADAHFADGPREAQWLGWGATRRARHLIEATTDIERLGGARSTSTADRAKFRGAPSTTTQKLFFPRSGDTDAAGLYVVPPDVQAAVCEQAFWRMADEDAPPLTNHDANREAGVAMAVVDGKTDAYRPTVGADWEPGIAPRARRLIRPYRLLAMPTRV